MVVQQYPVVIQENALDILTIADIDIEDVTFPETGYAGWNGLTFRVRSITADEREHLLQSSVVIDGAVRRVSTPLMRVRLVCLAVVDADGNRVFRDSQLKQLGQKSAKAIDFLADAAMRLAGLTDDTGADAGKAPSSEPTNGTTTG